MNDPGFVHLRVHSEYSLVDGLVRIKPLVKRAAELEMPAVGITDQSNLFALVKFYRASIAQGIKPVVGADVLVHNEDDAAKPFRLTLFVLHRDGYLTLSRLISRAYLHGQRQGIPLLTSDWLFEDHHGLIAVSGGLAGEIGYHLKASAADHARAALQRWMQVFDDRFYLELYRTCRPDEEAYIDSAVELAAEFGAPVVATNDVRFLHAAEFEAHEARVCIHQSRILDDPRRPRDYSEYQYFRDQAEMVELFSDIPSALQNSVEIARRCNLELQLGDNYLPDFPVPEGLTPDQHFMSLSRSGLEARLEVAAPVGQGTEQENREAYETRLQRELDVIVQMGFPGYFLIVADFIRWAKQNGIPVGPGRGSGAGSLVAYALGITDLDPIEFDLLFERFLNPERVSMPDFDVDFCMEGRDRVIEYVAETYGRDKVSQIITYGSMAARAVVRDVGRVLGYSYGFTDKLAKLIPFEIGMTLQKALAESADLKQQYDDDEDTRELIDLAGSLEGVARNAGKHAGGVVIAPSRLTDFTPLYCEQGGNNLVTQFDKDDVEAVGLVKFDFLGLRTLTIIDWAVKSVNQRLASENRPLLDINQVPRDDPASYELLKSCATTAVFQLESRGMKDLIRRLKPDSFEDVIALVALFRPGPLQSGMVDDYINVKHGQAQAEYPHPLLEPILKPTNGVILYQEQVMEIARELAGYTLGGADLLRRAMGKKKPEEMAKQREIFVTGAVENSIEQSVASYIFDLMEKFAGYGFNKSHSAAYALVAYQTAWLKAHYPAEFMAAVLSSDMDNTDKVVTLIEECRSMDLKIVSPDVNQSVFRFLALDNSRIVYGLGAIKGVGAGAVENIVEQRNQSGNYRDLFDFCERVDLFKVNKRVLEALIRSGAMDSLGLERSACLRRLPLALKAAEQQENLKSSGQHDLFGLSVPKLLQSDASANQTATDPWSENQRLAEEKATLGLYLTGHPVVRYQSELEAFTSGRIARLLAEADHWAGKNPVRVAGLVVDLRTRESKRGKRMAFATLDDRSGRIEIAAFSECYQAYRELLARDVVLVAEGAANIDDFSGSLRLTVERLYSIEQARSEFARYLQINWQPGTDGEFQSGTAFVTELKQLVAPYVGGSCPVCIEYRGTSASTRLQLGEQWQVHPADELLNRLQHKWGSRSFCMRYGAA